MLRFNVLAFAAITSASIVWAAPAFAATTWYVNGVKGNDNNNCMTPQTACKTITHAISLASPGDSIRVAAAHYKEAIGIDFSLKIIGAGAKSTVIVGGGVGSGDVVDVSGSTSHVVLSKLTILKGDCVVENSGILTVNDSVISEGADYGGIENFGTLMLNRSNISYNNTEGFDGYDGYGAGILNYGIAVINNSTITGNTATAQYSYGGGISTMGGTLTINNSTISANVASGLASASGGGIDIGGATVVNNSTISGNNASAPGGETYGGGIALAGSGPLTISSSTLVGNYVDNGGQGGGIAGPATLQNTIVAQSHHGGNCYGAMTSNGYNLSSDKTCNFNGPGDLNDTKPKLGTLGNHGGPTQTIPERLDSPTVDAGNPNGCTDGNGKLLTTDQRGYPRPGKDKHDKRCDMGAYERQTD